MIEVEHLAKSYGDFHAVRDVTFTAGKGEVVGFLGPNGAGKTTTLRMLTTYMPPSSGTSRIAGSDIIKNPEQVRRKIGYLPETPPLYKEMTVREYLLFIARIREIPSKEIKARVEEAESSCFLSDVKDRLCQNLSKGYRQRVGLAQAIIHKPEVIILDEPTSGLDPRQIIDIRKLILSLAKDRTVILSTHILPEVTAVCSKVVIVNRGLVVLQGSIGDVTRTKSLEEVFMECVRDEGIEMEKASNKGTSDKIKVASI
jgi:ABC-2 type transport system ATP-binding protein